MSLERAFHFCSLLLAAVAFIGLVLTGEIPAGLVVLGLAALAVTIARTKAGGLVGRRPGRLRTPTVGKSYASH